MKTSQPQITNAKILRIANNLKEFTNPQEMKRPSEVYRQLVAQDNLKDYYGFLGPDNFIKVCIALWGLTKGHTPEEIESFFNRVFFANLFLTDGSQYYEECGYCDGNGSESCDTCDGDGDIECDECEGDGMVRCQECEGKGIIENDEGEVEDCDECDGTGDVSCDNCGGSGRQTCGECDGDGTTYCSECEGDGNVETDEMEYTLYYIVSWDTKLKNLMELRAGQFEPIMSEDKFLKNKKLIVLTTLEDEHGLIDSDVENGEIYCTEFFSNRPKTKFDFNSYGYFFQFPPYNLGVLES